MSFPDAEIRGEANIAVANLQSELADKLDHCKTALQTKPGEEALRESGELDEDDDAVCSESEMITDDGKYP